MDVTLDEIIVVDTNLESVWKFINDPYKMVACAPGAELVEEIDENTFKGLITIKIGPVTTKYEGIAKIEERNKETGTMKLTGQGVDTQGQGSANMTLIGQVKPGENNTCEIHTSMKVSVSGKVAQLGSRMIRAVNQEMFKKFKKNLIEALKDPENMVLDKETKPIGAISLFFTVTLHAITSPFVKLYRMIAGKPKNVKTMPAQNEN